MLYCNHALLLDLDPATYIPTYIHTFTHSPHALPSSFRLESTGKERSVLVSDPRCDVGGVMMNDETFELEAVELNYEVSE